MRGRAQTYDLAAARAPAMNRGMQTIIGRFADASRVQEAVGALLASNLDKSDISYIGHDPAGRAAPPRAETGEVLGARGNVGKADRVPEAVTAGSGNLGAGIAGLLTGMFAFAIPGIGPLLAAGPLAVGLAGAGAGTARDDIERFAKALHAVGVPDGEARGYAEAVRGGGALILIRAREIVGDDIAAILQERGAASVERFDRGEN